ncbi:S15/NS1 RNA-binding domain-containing protein [Suillus decipiens]|nr:S15/NS1 RNA-binding domain-containing protein [Suillus decipiens]
MFKSCLTNASQSVASSSRSLLHTSAVLNARISSKQARHEKISKVQARINHKLAFDAQREYAVLGHRPGQDHKWRSCALAKVIVTEDALYSDSVPEIIHNPEGDIELPPHLNFGVTERSKELLFKVLPPLSAQEGVTKFRENVISEMQEAMENEKTKANMFAKVIDLRNSNAKGLAFENRRRCIKLFSSPGNPFDTGRPEVQAALLTIQIRGLWKHLLAFRKDIDNRRGLRQLVHKRAKILKYLRRLDRDRYEAILPRLGLDAASVEGELVV